MQFTAVLGYACALAAICRNNPCAAAAHYLELTETAFKVLARVEPIHEICDIASCCFESTSGRQPPECVAATLPTATMWPHGPRQLSL